jgi:hypothetical protein
MLQLMRNGPVKELHRQGTLDVAKKLKKMATVGL